MSRVEFFEINHYEYDNLLADCRYAKEYALDNFLRVETISDTAWIVYYTNYTGSFQDILS